MCEYTHMSTVCCGGGRSCVNIQAHMSSVLCEREEKREVCEYTGTHEHSVLCERGEEGRCMNIWAHMSTIYVWIFRS